MAIPIAAKTERTRRTRPQLRPGMRALTDREMLHGPICRRASSPVDELRAMKFYLDERLDEF